MTFNVSMSVSVVGDDYLWKTLKAGKLLLKSKQFAEALQVFVDAARHCESQNWGTGTVDVEIARALVGLNRAPEAISLLERHLHEHGATGEFERLVKIYGDIGKGLMASGDKTGALEAYNKALSVAHLFSKLSTILRTPGIAGSQTKYEAASTDLLNSVKQACGSIYGFTFAKDGAPPNGGIMCDRDLTILAQLSAPPGTPVEPKPSAPKKPQAEKRQGTCESCNAADRSLHQLGSGQWLCRNCMKELRPKRDASHASLAHIRIVRQHGIQVDDFAKEVDVSRYLEVCKLWDHGGKASPEATVEEIEAAWLTVPRDETLALIDIDGTNADGQDRQEIINGCTTGEQLTPVEGKDSTRSSTIALHRASGEQVGYSRRPRASSSCPTFDLGSLTSSLWITLNRS